MHKPYCSDPIGQLTELGMEYRYLESRHREQAPNAPLRSQFGSDMKQLARRFERQLDQWVEDPVEYGAWREFFYRNGEHPTALVEASPPLYRGVSEQGTRLEVVAAPDGGYDYLLDGQLREHHEVPWHLDPELGGPLLIGDAVYRESFSSPGPDLECLQESLRSGTQVPGTMARRLFADGIIAIDFALTARGARRLATQDRPPSRRPTRRVEFCVVVASPAKARIFTMRAPAPGEWARGCELQEVVAVASLADRARRERFSSSASAHQNQDVRAAVSSGDDARRFAQAVARMAIRTWNPFATGTVIIAARLDMLEGLRTALAGHGNRLARYQCSELDRELSQLSTLAVHQTLADAGLLPACGPRSARRQPSETSRSVTVR